MRITLILEELFMLGLSMFLFSKLEYSWWLYAVLFLAPDMSMVGYFFNPRIGSWTYNFVHHKATGISLYVLGILLLNPMLQFTGLLLFGHSSFDRLFGYGLKYPDAFQHTHLGMIGKEK